ncbi:ribosomal L27e protein family-domain-containing protein [Lactifluus volemus]|nr:ribosomal L27e protein family-domain-containing protein [Lactifluus volemus]
MVKVYKPGKVAIVLQGRQAGRKVVVIKQVDDGTKDTGALLTPLKVTKRMGATKLARRSKVKPFIKVHIFVLRMIVHLIYALCGELFPTRYSVELEGLKGILSSETFKEPSQRTDSKKQIKNLLEDRYKNGKYKWFFQPLRVIPNVIRGQELRVFNCIRKTLFLLNVLKV